METPGPLWYTSLHCGCGGGWTEWRAVPQHYCPKWEYTHILFVGAKSYQYMARERLGKDKGTAAAAASIL